MAYLLASIAFMVFLASHAPKKKSLFSPWHQRAVALLLGVGAFDSMLLPLAEDWMGTLGVTAAMVAAVWYGHIFWLRDFSGKPVRLRPRQQSLRDYAPAVLLFFSVAGMLYRTMPSLFGSGEMWAEAATNYFWHARYDDLLTNLTTLDAGYVPLAARLCAVAIQATRLSPQLIPYAYQAWTLLFISACLAYLALPRWRCLIPSDLARCMICVALACHPDFDLKAFINFPYYGAIPLFLHLMALVQDQLIGRSVPDERPSVPAWRVLGFSLFAGVFCVSKPHFIAFAPTLALLLLLGLRRRRLALLAPACAGLAALGVQMVVLVQSRAADTNAARPGLGVLARWLAQLTFVIPAMNLGGKALWVPAMASHALSSFMVIGGLVAAGFMAQHICRGDRQALVGVVAVGLSTFFGALLLSVMAFVLSYQAVWQSDNFESVALRWFFMPCLAAFLVLAVIIARSYANRHVPWLLGAWLLASFPFGFGAWPVDAVWAKVGYSSWQSLAPQVFGADGDKGCIPVDPLPFTFQIDCEPLLTLSPEERAGGYVTLVQEIVVAAPKEAVAWSVDSFSVLFERLPPFNAQPVPTLVTAKALGQDGQVLGTAQGRAVPGTLSVNFAFKPAVNGVAALALTAEKSGSLNLMSRTGETLDPIWMWFGRRFQGANVAKG